MARKRKQPDSGPPATPPANPLNDWVNSAYGVVAICLLGLAVTVILGIDIPVLRWIFIGVIAAAGTVAVVMQAGHACPGCGMVYGYHLRIVNANKCRRCGAELPDWLPGKNKPS